MVSSESSDESMEDEEETQHSKPFKGARPASGEAGVLSDDNSDDSSGFIVEDDSQTVTAQLPTEFSSRSHDDLSHHFKIIFQFFVHIAVHPASHRRAFMEDQMKRDPTIPSFVLSPKSSFQCRSGILFRSVESFS